MPAATNKVSLLAAHRKEYDKLHSLLAAIDDNLALRPFEDGATIKDVIGHRAHWIQLFLGWYAGGRAGQQVFFPAEGYKWSDLKAYNAALRDAQQTMSWAEAKALLEANHQKLSDLIEGLDDAALYGDPMKGARNAWTTGRWAEASGSSHYRSAAKFIRKCLRAAG